MFPLDLTSAKTGLNPPETLPSFSGVEGVPRRRSPIDIERLVRWAFAEGREDGAVWREDAGLSLNRGLTVIPKHRGRVSWAEAAARAGVKARSPRLRLGPAIADADAALVAEAVCVLPSKVAFLVRYHARCRTRPPWYDKVERLVPDWRAPGQPRIGYGYKRKREGPYCRLLVVVDEKVTAKSRERYAVWHRALRVLAIGLANNLERWEISGFAAPAEPWSQQDLDRAR